LSPPPEHPCSCAHDGCARGLRGSPRGQRRARGYHPSVRTVVVVGAGGSLAQAQGYRPAMTGLHPPLDVDFFNRTRRLTESKPVIARALNTLRIAIDRSARFTYPWDPVLVPMEQFFADVYFEVTNDARTTHLNVYRALLALYVRVLAETTNWMMLRGPGQLDRLIRSEVRRAGSDELTVVTLQPGSRARKCRRTHA
jgi:hypothetical protein